MREQVGAKLRLAVIRWFDSYAQNGKPAAEAEQRVDWVRIVPFIAIHLVCFAVILVGWSWTALGTCIGLYFVRMFAITGFYHRYFSHRTFKTDRVTQFVFGVLGASTMQRGPLWWASHHRWHHRRSDTAADVHSPVSQGFLWSHMGWITSEANFRTDQSVVRDLARFPELVLLDRFDILPPLTLAVLIFLVGEALAVWAPSLHTSGSQMLIWGFFISSVVLMHATFLINSVAHVIGSKRFDTGDDSRNNLMLALLTMGEGWHNNHHHYPASAHQGFYWWEIDLSYYCLKVLAWCGIVWDLRQVPGPVLLNRRLDSIVAKTERPSGEEGFVPALADARLLSDAEG